MKLLGQLEKESGGKLELFFASYGLGDVYSAPTKGWGKAKRIAAAIAAAERRGNGDSVLTAAAEHFDLLPAKRLPPARQARCMLGFPRQTRLTGLTHPRGRHLRLRMSFANWRSSPGTGPANGRWRELSSGVSNAMADGSTSRLSLMSFLAEHGVDAVDRGERARAIDADEMAGGNRSGQKVSGWLSQMKLKLAGSSARVSEGAAAAVIGAAVARYLGIG